MPSSSEVRARGRLTRASIPRLALESVGLSLEMLDSWDFNPLKLEAAQSKASAVFFLSPANHGVQTMDPSCVATFLELAEKG